MDKGDNKTMIAIIDYGMGNLRSVQKAFETVGIFPEIIDSEEELKKADAIVLPGVGAFADAMDNLDRMKLTDVLKQEVISGKPFLGICLGMQLLFTVSEEQGEFQGLDLLPGRVRKMPAEAKIPHMGWNQIEIQQASPLLAGIPDGANYYFVHSYFVDPSRQEDILTKTDYNFKFASIVGRDNIFGIQFHPEKSSRLGLQILKNFGEVVKQC